MRLIIFLLIHEIKMSSRTGGGMPLALGFFTVLIMLIPIGIGSNEAAITKLAPGMIWIGVTLSVLLSLDRLFHADEENGTLDVLILSPLTLEVIVIIKASAHWISTCVPIIILTPILSMTLSMNGSGIIWLALTLLIGTPALSFLGAMGATLTLGIQRGGLLLALIVLPIFIPTLMFGIQTTILCINGSSPNNAFIFMGAISLLSIALTPFICAKIIRLNIE